MKPFSSPLFYIVGLFVLASYQANGWLPVVTAMLAGLLAVASADYHDS